jgi:hypothetical protein
MGRPFGFAAENRIVAPIHLNVNPRTALRSPDLCFLAAPHPSSRLSGASSRAYSLA